MPQPRGSAAGDQCPCYRLRDTLRMPTAARHDCPEAATRLPGPIGAASVRAVETIYQPPGRHGANARPGLQPGTIQLHCTPSGLRGTRQRPGRVNTNADRRECDRRSSAISGRCGPTSRVASSEFAAVVCTMHARTPLVTRPCDLEPARYLVAS